MGRGEERAAHSLRSSALVGQALCEGKRGQIPPKAGLGPFCLCQAGGRGLCDTGMCPPSSSSSSWLQLPLPLPPAQHVCTWVCVSLGVLLLLLNLQNPPSCGGAGGFGGAAGALRIPPLSEELVFCIS